MYLQSIGAYVARSVARNDKPSLPYTEAGRRYLVQNCTEGERAAGGAAGGPESGMHVLAAFQGL